MKFSTALAHEHAMLLVFVVPHLALGVAFVWEETGKKRVNATCEASLYRANRYDESPVWIAASVMFTPLHASAILMCSEVGDGFDVFKCM
jgi:hypothetical protein